MRISTNAAWRQESALVATNVLKTPLRWRSTTPSVAEHGDATGATADADWQNARHFEEIPGPRSLPVIGQVWHFLPRVGTYGGLKRKELMEKLHKDYGPIVKLDMPTKDPVVFLQRPDDFETVLRTEGQWPLRDTSESWLYWQKVHRAKPHESLALAQGKEWGEYRSAVNQILMQPRNVKSYVEPIDVVTQDFISRIRKIRDGEGEMPDNFCDELGKWALESVTFMALDTRLGAIENEDPNSEAIQTVRAMQTFLKNIYVLDHKMSPWRYITTPKLRDMMKSMDYLYSVTEKYVRQAMERVKSSPPSEVTDRNLSILEKLLKGTDEDRAIFMAMDMIAGGADTTSSGVGVTLYYLATNPEKQRKLQEEVDRVIPDRQQPISKEQLEQLKYVRACIKEATRLEPVASANVRNAGRDLVLHGYRVPRLTKVVMNNFLACTDEACFPRAQEFLPERWLPEGSSLKAKHPFAYLPFGFGPRVCVGKRLADMEMEIFVARVFQNFNVEWNRPPPETDAGTMIVFLSPLKFTMKDRQLGK